MKSPPLDREDKAILAKLRRYQAKEARDEEREAQKLASKALIRPMELRSAALTQPMELQSAGPAAASSVEFVLTNTTPGVRKGAREQCGGITHCAGRFCKESRGY